MENIGICYGNYCRGFGCKPGAGEDAPPISEIDLICK
jgi:hypothetical protein